MPWRLFLYILGFFHRMLQYQYIHVDNGVSAIVISRVILHEHVLRSTLCQRDHSSGPSDFLFVVHEMAGEQLSGIPYAVSTRSQL